MELWEGSKKVVCELKINSKAELKGISKDWAILLVNDANEFENEIFLLNHESFT